MKQKIEQGIMIGIMIVCLIGIVYGIYFLTSIPKMFEESNREHYEDFLYRNERHNYCWNNQNNTYWDVEDQECYELNLGRGRTNGKE